MKKKIAVGNLGAEERAQTEYKVITRAQTRAEADLLFNHKATEIAAANQKRMKQLFVQAPGAETMAPSLAKISSVMHQVYEAERRSGGIHKTAAVDAFFDGLAEKSKTAAQRRYPELLKASAAPGGRGTFPVASQKKSVPGAQAGAHPSTSSLSGGAA